MSARAEHLRSFAAALATALLLAPLLGLVLGALHPPGVVPRGLGVVPSHPGFASLERAFELVPLRTQLGNSLLVVLVAVPVSLLSASLAAFAVVLSGERLRRGAIVAALLLLVLPASAIWVPRFVAFSQFGLVDSLVPLMAPALMGTTPLAFLLFLWSYRRIPRSLIDAARIEGLGPLALWRTVGAPWGRASVAAVGAVVFLAHWGNFVDPLLYVYSPEHETLPLGLSRLRLLGPGDQATILAGTLVAAVPAVAAFLVVARRFFDVTGEAGWLGRS